MAEEIEGVLIIMYGKARSSVLLIFILILLGSLTWTQQVQAQDGNKGRNSNKISSNQGSLSFTISECVKRGLKENPKIKAAEYEVKKAQSDIGSARGSFYPQLSAYASRQDIKSIDAKGPTDEDYVDQVIDVFDVRASQTLFAGLTIFNEYQRSKLMKELSKREREQVEMRLVLDIQTNFLELLKAREDIKRLEDAVHRLKVNVDSAKAFYNQKMAPYVQVLQAEVDLADAEQKLSQARNQAEIKRQQLNVMLGFSPEREIDYVGQLENQEFGFSSDLHKCMHYAFEHRPEILVARKSLDIAQKDEDIALGQFSPKVDLNFDYYSRDDDYDDPGVSYGQEYDRDQENTYWTAQVKLQWKLFQGGKRYYNYQKTQQEIMRIKQKLRQSKDKVKTQVRSYLLYLQEARGRIGATKKAKSSALESYNRAKKRFELKMGSIPEVLDSQARLTKAEANYCQAIADYRLNLARLYYVMGKRNYALSVE